MNEYPLVSVIIPTYRRADMLTRAVDSCLNQTYKHIEVIVVDDNNPDSEYRSTTEAIMKRYSDNSKVSYIKHKENRNGSAARNTGMWHAEGVYVCFLDDDDYFYQDKVQLQVDFLQTHPEYKAVYCGWSVEDENIIPYRMGNLTYEQLTGSYIISTVLIMMERDVALQFGGWDERLKRNQDVAFMLRYFNLGYEVGVVQEILVHVDLADRSNFSNPQNSEKDMDQFLEYYSQQIDVCEREHKNARKHIYASRYRGVMLRYLKNKDLKGMFRLYKRIAKYIPWELNTYLVDACVKKVLHKPLYGFSKGK